jgi:beta-glucosidase
VGQDLTVTVAVTNKGSRAGEEVAQLYISEKAPRLPRPVKELRGFGRLALEPGETKDISFVLRERELAYFDDSQGVKRFVCQPDDYEIMVGPSSKTLPLKGTLKVQ